MRDIWIVLRREFLIRLLTRSFAIATLAGIVSLIAIGSLPQVRDVLTGDHAKIVVNCTGAGCDAVRTAITGWSSPVRIAPPGTPGVVAVVDVSRDAAGRLHAVVRERSGAATAIENSLHMRLVEANVILNAPQLAEPAQIDRTGVTVDASATRRAIAGLLCSLLYISVITYGIFVATALVEEKTTKTVDLLLAATSPRALLAGKVLAIAGIGATQLVAIVAGGSVVLSVLGRRSASVAVPALPSVSEILVFFTLFVVGYFSFAAVYAVLGACIRDFEKVRQYAAIVAFPTYLAMFFAMSAIGSGQPPNLVLTFVPLFSPLLMLARLGTAGVGVTELALFAVVNLAFIAVMFAIAAHFYTNASLLRPLATRRSRAERVAVAVAD